MPVAPNFKSAHVEELVEEVEQAGDGEPDAEVPSIVRQVRQSKGVIIAEWSKARFKVPISGDESGPFI